MLDVVGPVMSVSSGVTCDAVGLGLGNGQESRPSVAFDMYFCQIWAGNEPPVTDLPWTLFMSRPSSGYPIQTAVVSLQVNPTNQASRYSSVVPVLPATGWPILAAVPVPPSTTWLRA